MMKVVVDETRPTPLEENIPDLRHTLKFLNFAGMVCVKPTGFNQESQ
ncbi:MAG: hypothetical protein ACXAC8_05875 [Candidatus Hodarchaeales archaeon]|jgi:hypothetical protein